MDSSTGLGAVGGQGAGRTAEAVVERDRRGERQEAGADARAQAVEGARAVAFERQQVFAGLKDRLDPLADRGQVGPAAAFVLASGTHDGGLQLGGVALEIAAGVALVPDHDYLSGSVDA